MNHAGCRVWVDEPSETRVHSTGENQERQAMVGGRPWWAAGRGRRQAAGSPRLFQPQKSSAPAQPVHCPAPRRNGTFHGCADAPATNTFLALSTVPSFEAQITFHPFHTLSTHWRAGSPTGEHTVSPPVRHPQSTCFLVSTPSPENG